MCTSPQTYHTENTESKETKRNKTEKTIYKNRKVNYLSTYRGLERGGDYSWEIKANALECSFKKLTKFLNRSIKGL